MTQARKNNRSADGALAPAFSAAALSVALAAFTFFAFLPALRAGFIWDDQFVTENPVLRSARGLLQIWTDPSANVGGEHYWPLTYTTFWIEHHLWKLAPAGFHFTNILLHVTNTLLVWRLLERLKVPGAALAAAIFGVHPVHVESVAWVIERKDVLAGLFYLLSAIFYLRFDEERRKSLFIASLALFLCAMLSKSVAITLPVALALVLWWKHGRISLRELSPLAVFVGAGVAVEAFSYFVMTGDLERAFRTSGGPKFGLSIAQRTIIAGRALWFYVIKLLWPAPLMTIYPKWKIDPTHLWLWGFPILAALAVFVLWLARKSIGLGAFAAVGYFALTHLPTLGLVDFGHMQFSYVADRFQYLPVIGPIALIGALATRLERSVIPSARTFLRTLFALVLAALALLTWRQCGLYKSREMLWLDNIKKNPGAPSLYYDLGILRREEGKRAEAIDYYTRALEVDPEYANAHNNLGVELMDDNRLPEAVEHFREALRLAPDFGMAYNNLGMAEMGMGRFDEAASAVREAIRIEPGVAGYYLDLGLVERKVQRWAQAREALAKAAELDPTLLEAKSQLGDALLHLGRAEESAREFAEVARLSPDSAAAHFNLGVALGAMGPSQIDRAIEEFKRAVEIDPNYVEARKSLEGALELKSRERR